ncbi:3-oxoacyl-ACP synthase [Tenacibaculum aquimarinum]|uniref:3-oxoacyl-ACP synthase n=1 Tax=Tenacibaculum aquimarinum TaxID=2910675 RepID=UPI001F0A6C1F|nr:3-oxoacyl-ACP synthase [Tenacibaculum aquimarinum]MCH3883834.1 3-oxoacyl-ACP synthase [Tenacibaculum aquimarinum]
METKEELYKLCKEYVNKRLQTVEDIISSNQKALQSETKSSAGDKHETGRAMLQLEMEKAGQQLAGITQMKEVLARIDVKKTSKVARLGSLISTDKANYFLIISAGKLTAFGKDYFAISVVSPIGKLLLGKQKNDVIIFNNNKSIIKKII